MSTPDEINTIIADIEKRERYLSDWERSYIDSISVQLGRGLSLTIKQDEKLTAIWERIT